MVHNSTDQEILEEKQLIEMLRESERKYRFLFENSKDAIYVTRRNGEFVDVNPATADLLGYRREEILELNTKAFYVNPGDRKIFQEEIEKRGSVMEFEVKLRKNDGTMIDCLLSATAITAVNGSIEGYQGIIRDITEYKRVKKNLKASQKYTQNIIDSSLDMIIAVNKRRRITEFNKAAEDTFGYSRDEVLGKHVNLLYADIKEGIEVHNKTVKNRYNVQEVLNRRKNGEIFPSFLSASILIDSEKNRVGVMGISRDITELKKSQQLLNRVNRALLILSECNKTMMSSTDEISLLNEICEIIVNRGRYRLAWVGYAVNDRKKSVRSMAHAGYEENYLETLDIRWSSTSRGRGPTGTAIRTEKPVIARDILTEWKW